MRHVACLIGLGWLPGLLAVGHNHTQVTVPVEPLQLQDDSPSLADFEGSSEELQLRWLSKCKNDDERALLGAQAIKCGSTAVFTAGAAIIVAMAGATDGMVDWLSTQPDETSDTNNRQLQSCLPTLARRLQLSQSSNSEIIWTLQALSKICAIRGTKCNRC